MRRAIEHLPAQTAARPLGDCVGTLTLPFEDRHKRCLLLTDDARGAFLLDLPQAVRMEHGDRLLLDGGGWLEVHAAAEAVLTISTDHQE